MSPTEKDCGVGFVALQVVTSPLAPLALEALDDDRKDELLLEALDDERADELLLKTPEEGCPVALELDALLDKPCPDEPTPDPLRFDEVLS